MDLLDIVTLMVNNDPTPEQKAAFEKRFKVTYKQPSMTCIVNVSQALIRQPWRPDDGLPTLTTNSKYYSMEHKKLLSPVEHFQLNGWRADEMHEILEDVKVPYQKLMFMAGNAMAVPCIGLVTAALIGSLYSP
jgi:hypothetical protein